jgi:hypothetical protein
MLSIFVGYRLQIMRFFNIGKKNIDLFDSKPKFIHIHTISVGIEISSKNGFKNQFIYFYSFFNNLREL